MAIYNVKLLSKKQVADGTTEFSFEKPEAFEYRAGQFFDIILDKPNKEAKKNDYVHGFSFVTAPFEPHIAAATRMRPDSKFKNALNALAIGSSLKIEAAWGSFTLKKSETAPVVYIIGGIGITPVHSMVSQASKDKSTRQLTLIYANRSPANAAYTQELEQLAQQNSHFTLVPVYSDEKVAGEEHGLIDGAMIKRHVPGVKEAIYYMSGPAGMVRASRDTLMQLGVDEDNIRTEEFDGY